jgi:putative hydrolase of the HAD superfamily
VGALVFEPVPGAPETVRMLRERGLRLAVVANWDSALPEHLDRLGLARHFDTIVTSAEAGVPKPDPAIFRLALERLGAEPARALHVGDEPVDEEGARSTGMRFAPAPLATAFEGWT